MPWSDWQFWVVTLVTVVAAWWVVRPLLPKRKQRGTTTKVNLTVGGRKQS